MNITRHTKNDVCGAGAVSSVQVYECGLKEYFAQFFWSMENFSCCQQIWCRECYTTRTTHLFHVASLVAHGGLKGSAKEMQETKERLQRF